MGKELLKVLAVDDPAVSAYTDEKLGLMKGFDMDVQFDAVPWSVYYDTMLQVFRGEKEYDIVMVAGHLWLRDFVEKGYLAEISYDMEDILPVIAKEMQCGGKTYLSPSFCDGHIITYRKSVVKEILGKELPVVVTPQEFVEAAEKIAAATGKPAVALKADESEIFTDAIPFMRMYGKDVYDPESHKAVCDEPEIIRGLEQYCGLKKIALDGTEKFGNGEIADAIRQRKAPIVTTWSGQMGVVYDDGCEEKEDLGYATFSTAWNVSWSFAVSAVSKKKKEAEALLAYLRSPEVDRVAGSVSGAPVRKGSYTAGMEQYPWYACQLQMMERAVALPNMVNAGDKNGVFYHEIAEAFAGNKTPEQAMKDAKEAVNRI
jgi:multiple sugar transport system substrate-binding protein